MKVIIAIPDFPPASEAPDYINKESRSRPGTLPLGPFYIAAYLEKHGIEVEIIDNFVLNLPSQEFVQRIVDMDPSIIGFSVNSFTYPQGKQNMKALKAILPDVPIIVGGVHATLFPADVAKESFVDFVVNGEGEATMVDLVQTIEKKGDFTSVKGVLFQKADGSVYVSEKRPFLNFDNLPPPARHLKNFNDYTRGKTNYINVEPLDVIASSRGCPFDCTFCSSTTIWGRGYRRKSAKKIVDELEDMVKNCGTKAVYFREDNFTVNKARVIELCDEMKKRGINIPWMCESRVDLISEDILGAMKSAGCKGIWFGIESGSDKILDYMLKGVKTVDVERCIKLCKKYGIKTGASFMIGLPPETKEDMKKSFEFAKKLDCHNTWFNQFIGVPNSAIYKEIKNKHYYVQDWNGIYAVETPHMTFKELSELEVKFNDYFKLRRWKTLVKVMKPSNVPKAVPKAARIVKNALLARFAG